MRDAEESEYPEGRDFHRDEVNYRRGFEAAMTNRGKEIVVGVVCSEEDASDEVFRTGYAHGQRYHCRL